MTTFPSVTVTDIQAEDPVLGTPTGHKNLPCIFCMCKGEFGRFGSDRRAVKLVNVADIVTLPLCFNHAADFVGDKR